MALTLFTGILSNKTPKRITFQIEETSMNRIKSNRIEFKTGSISSNKSCNERGRREKSYEKKENENKFICWMEGINGKTELDIL